MELASVKGEGLDENARQAFADLVARITGLVQETLSEGVARGEFNGDPEIAALHIVTVTRGLAVLERAFGDEAQLRKIAAHTVDLVLGKAEPLGVIVGFNCQTARRYASAFSRLKYARALRNFRPPRKSKGRRESRVHAAPAVSCAICAENAHTSIQVQRRHPGFPCAMGYGLLRALPGERLSCHRRPRKAPLRT